MATLKELRDRVRTILGEPQPVFWLDKELNEWIRDAEINLALRLPYAVAETLDVIYTYTISTIHGKEKIDLPANFLKIFALRRNNHISRLIAIEDLSAIYNNTYYAPSYNYSYYYIYDKSLYVFPPIHSSYDTLLQLYYTRIPTKMIADDNLTEIPYPFEELIILYTVAKARQKDPDNVNSLNIATTLFAEYDKKLAEMISFFSIKPIEVVAKLPR